MNVVRQKYIKWAIALAVMMSALLFSALLALSVGEFYLAPGQVLKLFLSAGDSMEYTILTQIRLPRVVLGIAIGGSLSLAGVLLQGVYRNPLVEPYTLGISGGASLGVAFAIVFGLPAIAGSVILPIAGFAGAFVTIFLVYIISLRSGKVNIHTMLLTGVMVSFIASSTMMLLMATTSSENLHGIVFWIMGSLDEPDALLIRFSLILGLVMLVVSYLFVQPLNALRLGQEKAKYLGIDTDTAVKWLFLMASLLAGTSVAVAGVIGFVGLIIPHMVRLIVGPDYRILLVSSFLVGAIFLLLSDIVARIIISPNELPIGVITGIAGGIVFLLMMGRKSFQNNNRRLP